MDDLQKIDLIDKIKGYVLPVLPDLLNHVNDQLRDAAEHHPSWYKQKLLAELFDISDSLPAGRRQLLRLAGLLEVPKDNILDPNTVAEEPASYSRALNPQNPWEDHPCWMKRRDRLIKNLEQFGNGSGPSALAKEIFKFNHLRQAVDHTRKNLKLLSGQRVYRFLASIGYPLVLPDSARRTFLFRIGLTSSVEKSQNWPEQFFATCETLAHLSGESPALINRLLAYYTGVDKDKKLPAVCTTRPRCQICPINNYCAYYRFNDSPKVESSRSGKIQQMNASERPRERLAKMGADSLSEIELLAILLRTGSGKHSALDLAALLLDRFGNLARIDQASIEELCEVIGIGPAKATELKAALELGRRMLRENAETETMDSSYKIFTYFRAHLGTDEQENFHILLLNIKNKIIRDVQATRGTIESSLVHPREAFKDAIRNSAASVIFIHNHPSGDPNPSQDDILLTNRLVEVGKILGIPVLDHIIITRNDFYSFADHQKIG